jgi:glycosyltransferase involved in cell wall biosynthesis
MIQLSVVIITYNEERNIGRCIESVKTVADDIVVIDSFSTDKTEEICKSKDVRFIQHKFEGHIEQKNWAITQANYPHVLSLDADEALSEQLQRSIAEVKNNWKYDGYFMNRLTNYCGQWIHHTGWYPDKKLRLWDSRKGKWGGVNPHDEFKLNNTDSAAGSLKGDILHYSYYSIEEHFKKIEYFADIASNALFNEGKKASFAKRFISPIAAFLGDYIIKLGFLDGYYGYVISKSSALATFQKYKKLNELYAARK